MSKPLHIQAYEIYEEKGQYGVFDWARAIGHKEWSWCVPCESSCPSHDGACLVCAEPVDTDHPINRANKTINGQLSKVKRAEACVKACEGMKDPIKEVSLLQLKLEAIRARLEGDLDNPVFVLLGTCTMDIEKDILYTLNKTL